MHAAALAYAAPLDDDQTELLSLLQTARDVAGMLRADLLPIVAADQLLAGAGRDAIVVSALTAADLRLTNIGSDLDVRADQIDVASKAPELAARYSGEGQRIAVSLRQAKDTWPKSGATSDEIVAAARAAADELYVVITRVARLTTAASVRSQLTQMQTGGALPYSRFIGDDDFLDEADQREVLQWLATQANAIPNGWIDVDQQLIYKLPPSSVGRAVRYSAPLIWLVLAAVVAVAAGELLADAKPLGTPGHMLAGAGIVLLGVLVHFLASAFKDKPWSGKIPVVGDWGKWWLLHPLEPAWLLLAPATTLVVLVLSGIDYHGEGFVTFILAGYSSDSIARSAFGRLDDVADKATKRLLPNPTAA